MNESIEEKISRRVRAHETVHSEKERVLSERDEVLDQCADRVVDHYADEIAARRIHGRESAVVSVFYDQGCKLNDEMFGEIIQFNNRVANMRYMKHIPQIGLRDITEHIELRGLSCRWQFIRERYDLPSEEVTKLVCGEGALRRFWVSVFGD